MAALEERPRDLAGATHAQLDPSPDLLSRIESATADRGPRQAWSPPPRLAAATALLVAVAAVVAVSISLGHRDPSGQVSAQPMTRDQFIAQAKRACDNTVTAFNQTTVVFPTTDGYRAVANTLGAATQRALAEADAGIEPPDARPTVDAVNADLRSALHSLEAVHSAAGRGDLRAAQAALDNFTTLTRHAGAALATYGAQHCTPPQP